jgi:hypothetical protein
MTIPRAVLILSAMLCAGCAAAESVPARTPPPAPVVVAAPPEAPSVSAAPALAEVSRASDDANERHAAVRDLRAAEEDLAASAQSCAVACRALGSMDHAASRLCGLVVTHSDSAACSDAVDRLREARRGVRASCGSCPGGPTVDPNAPAPTP